MLKNNTSINNEYICRLYKYYTVIYILQESINHYLIYMLEKKEKFKQPKIKREGGKLSFH